MSSSRISGSPVQYLPWSAAQLLTRAVEAALDRGGG
jgi:hypothetical protein